MTSCCQPAAAQTARRCQGIAHSQQQLCQWVVMPLAMQLTTPNKAALQVKQLGPRSCRRHLCLHLAQPGQHQGMHSSKLTFKGSIQQHRMLVLVRMTMCSLAVAARGQGKQGLGRLGPTAHCGAGRCGAGPSQQGRRHPVPMSSESPL
jgi:hypothetical protein